MRRLARIAVVLLAAVLLNACALWRPAVAPLRVLAAPAPNPGADTLLVLLPGSFSQPEEFVQEGFVETLRTRRAGTDVVMVDAHVGYYQNRSIVTRLADDVIGPARAKGYRHIWIAGISIGAVGAMLYADAHPDDLDGVVLIAPYLGTRSGAREVRLAGGLAKWNAPLRSSDEDVDPTLWRWLQAQTQTADAAARPRKLPLYLGYGLDDRFAFNDEVLSESMPASHVFTAPGGHDWPAWKVLWERIVEAAPIGADTSVR